MTSTWAKYVWVIGCFLAATACSTYRGGHHSIKAESNYCEPALVYHYSAAYLPETDVKAVLLSDTSLTHRFSQHDLLMANAMGILPLLRTLIRLQKAKSTQRSEQVEVKQKILNRLLLASTEISSLAAELDCEGERADQLATYLDQKDTRRIRRLTLLSVVIGAATTVATALIQSDNADKAIGIGGGVVSAGFGGLAAFSSNKTVRYMHVRNLLADVWNQTPHSSLYSPFVWSVLNEKLFSNSGQNSISYNIRQRWQGFVLNDADSKKQQLYFGEGGEYEADDLHTRSNMLNQLQSSVRSINQDLQSLMLNLPG